ncbi:unnamed protein product [Scytosiphon promiscuus]
MALADSPLISVRVVNVDWYLSEESKLPVVRIFGSTPAGQRSCLHLHGALPYFMVRPMEDENPSICAQFQDPNSLNALLPQLEQALESAMAASSGSGSGAPSLSPGKAYSAAGGARGGRPWRRNRQPVLARLEVVRGVPFYGYHGEEKLFVKVYVNNPALTGKVASVLQAGHVLSTRFQPYESHVPFLLQVFIDYNISGMSYVHLRNALFLQPLPEVSSIPSSQQPAGRNFDVNRVINNNSNQKKSALTGVFTSATVPEYLVANPHGQSDTGWPAPTTSAKKKTGDRSTDSAERVATARELEPVTLQGDTEEATQDLLAGISMSQLFSQPDSTPKVPRARSTPEKVPAARVGKRLPGSPPAPPGGLDSTARNRPLLRWWERQTTTELEVAGIVEDVINPKLWDEEKERSRAAGGGSQLSAPPGLELADSQDVWEPPEGLLTQHVKDEVEILARNVFGRRKKETTLSTQGAGESSQREASQIRSQVSTAAHGLERMSDEEALTPSQDGPSSPANYLPSQDAMDGDDDVDQGLLDMISALRGSQQSQGVEGESVLSPPTGRRYTQSPAGSLSRKPAFTPKSSTDHAEAVAATQKKQEQDEQELGNRMALEAEFERHYDSDGSENYPETTDMRAAVTGADRSAPAAAGTPPNTAPPAPSAAGMQTPVVAEPPPWSSSQRAASYPPWSQRSAGAAPASAASGRAVTLPFWSQRSTEVASGKFAGRGVDGGIHRGDPAVDVGDERKCSKISRGAVTSTPSAAGDVKDGVQAEIDRETRMPANQSRSPYGSLFASPAPGFEPRSQSELVDIICSQVEVEQDQAALGPNQENYQKPRGRRPRVDAGAAETEREVGAREQGSESPLRLRGGVGLARTKTKPPPRPSRPPSDPDQAGTSAPLIGDGSGPGSGAGGEGEDPPAGSKRPAPPPGTLAKRRAPLGAPGGLRRSSSVLGGGGFKPPRLLPTTASSVATGDEAAGAGDGGGEDSGSGNAAAAAASAGDKGGRSAGRDSPKSAVSAGESPADDDSDGGNGSSDTQEEESNKDERSQVVVPGWGSQGHHPVEYSESQLSFITTSQLRASPKLARARGGTTANETSAPESVGTPTKKQRISGAEGSARSESVESAPRLSPSKAEEGGRKGEDSRAAAGAALGLRGGATDRLRSDTPPREKEPASEVGAGSQDKGRAVSQPPEQPGRVVSGDALGPPAGKSGISEERGDVESRWRGADARLRQAQKRGTPSPPAPRRPSTGSGEVGVPRATDRGLRRMPPSYPASVPRPTTPSNEPETALNESGAVGRRRSQAGDSASSSPPVGLSHTGPPLDTPPCGEGGATETPVGGIHGAPATAVSQPDGTTGASRLSPAGVAAADDNSDMPPLGQPSPGLLDTATGVGGGGGGAAASPTVSGTWSGGEQESRNNHRGSAESPRPTPGGFFLTTGSGSAAESPSRERFSEFTPPTPRPRPGAGPRLGTVVLRPIEAAPDPAVCAAAMSRLGIPQVLHTEPHYSRKDDVPPRPREFAGNVFRIPHKDSLQTFDTLPSRQLLYAYRQEAAAAAATTAATPTPPGHHPSGSSSYCSSTPSPQSSHSAPRNHAARVVGIPLVAARVVCRGGAVTLAEETSPSPCAA